MAPPAQGHSDPVGGRHERELLGRNLTKERSPTEPVRRRSARSSQDDRVHLVEAAPVGLVDPSPLRTLCDRPVFEVFNDARQPTCELCLASGADAPRR